MKKLYILPLIFFLSIPMLKAQMYPDRHNTNWFDGWVSCASSISPNSVRGDVHWVMYDLGFDYPLGEINIWNCNIPDSTNMGLQNIIIDYSKDGVEWEELGDFTLTESQGSSIYQGQIVGTFDEQVARYVLINAMSNYGGDCYSFSEFRVNIAQVSVPVQLLSFDANCNENYEVVLDWSTTSEINNDYFQIEKSIDGVDWDIVGKVQATLVQQETNKYQFIDNSENMGTSYYRLVQYDRDGRRTDYQIRTATCDREISDIALYPNPAVSKIQVLVKAKESKMLQVQLVNSIGKEIQVMNISTNAEYDIDIKELPNGQYFLWIYNEGNILKEKFIKTK